MNDQRDTSRRRMAIVLRSIVLADNESVTRAAKRLGVGRPAVSNLLNGNASLSVEMAARIEDVFQVKAISLLTYQVELELEDYRRSTGSAVLPVFKMGAVRNECR